MFLLHHLFNVTPQPAPASAALLILRMVVGCALVIFGWHKVQNPFAWMGPESQVPGFLQFLATLSEFAGGLAWIVGLLSRLAALGIVSTMAVAVYTMMYVMNAPFVDLAGGISYTLPATFFAAALVILTMGPGRYSFDALLFKHRTTSDTGRI